MTSMTIEEQMLDMKLEDAMTKKLLVLGAGEAGKTTLVNQLIMNFNHGVTSTAVRDRASDGALQRPPVPTRRAGACETTRIGQAALAGRTPARS